MANSEYIDLLNIYFDSINNQVSRYVVNTIQINEENKIVYQNNIIIYYNFILLSYIAQSDELILYISKKLPTIHFYLHKDIQFKNIIKQRHNIQSGGGKTEFYDRIINLLKQEKEEKEEKEPDFDEELIKLVDSILAANKEYIDEKARAAFIDKETNKIKLKTEIDIKHLQEKYQEIVEKIKQKFKDIEEMLRKKYKSLEIEDNNLDTIIEAEKNKIAEDTRNKQDEIMAVHVKYVNKKMEDEKERYEKELRAIKDEKLRESKNAGYFKTMMNTSETKAMNATKSENKLHEENMVKIKRDESDKLNHQIQDLTRKQNSFIEKKISEIIEKYNQDKIQTILTGMNSDRDNEYRQEELIYNMNRDELIKNAESEKKDITANIDTLWKDNYKNKIEEALAGPVAQTVQELSSLNSNKIIIFLLRDIINKKYDKIYSILIDSSTYDMLFQYYWDVINTNMNEKELFNQALTASLKDVISFNKEI